MCIYLRMIFLCYSVPYISFVLHCEKQRTFGSEKCHEPITENLLTANAITLQTRKSLIRIANLFKQKKFNVYESEGKGKCVFI